MRRFWWVLGHVWMSPWTVLGLIFALVGASRFHRWDRDHYGALHFVAIEGGPLAWWFREAGFGGITIGGVIMFKDARHANLPEMIEHESVHVRQGMILGPLHPLFYGIASFISWETKQGIYKGNDYEEQARREVGQDK